MNIVVRHRISITDAENHVTAMCDPPRAMFSFTDCARYVVDLLDGLGIDRAHFAGNSWGGMIGGTFAALYPTA